VQLSELATLTAIGGLLEQAAMKVRSAAAKTLDITIRNDIGFAVADKAVYSAGMFNNLGIDGGSLNSSGKTARLWVRRADGFPMYHNKTRVAQSALVTSIAKSAMTVKTIQHGISVLVGNDADPTSNGMFRMIVHPDVSYQITTSSGFKGWFSPTTSEKVKMKPTEVGVIAGTMIETSTLAWKFPLSADTMSTASGSLYASLLFGAEAYGVASIEGANGGRSGFQFFLKESGPQSTNDPTNKIKQAAFSVTAIGRVLNKSAGMLLLSTEMA
jgi:N4-gp56 family major capsid protein